MTPDTDRARQHAAYRETVASDEAWSATVRGRMAEQAAARQQRETALAARVEQRIDELGVRDGLGHRPTAEDYLGASHTDEEDHEMEQARVHQLGLVRDAHEDVFYPPRVAGAVSTLREAQQEHTNVASMAGTEAAAEQVAEARQAVLAARAALEAAYDDEWVESGLEASHQAYLDERGNVDSGDDDSSADER